MISYSYYEQDPRVIREAEAALEGGFDVDFLDLRKDGSPPSQVIRGVNVYHLNEGKYRGKGHLQYLIAYLRFFLKCLGMATKLFFKRNYVAIHVNNMPDFLVFATLVPKLFGTKVILDIHDPMPDTFATKFRLGKNGFLYYLLLLQERLSAAYCDQVITVHDPVKDGILVKHGMPPGSIEVIANFADDQLFSARQSFSVDHNIKLVFHGTILERSGLRTLIEGVAGARHKNRISLKIIGEGDFSQTLTQLIRSSGLEGIVDFDNHSYPVHSIPEQIADCNVGVIPLRISPMSNYALPLKLVEYICLGLPVISVRSAAISYYLKESDCIFFDWDNPQSLSLALDNIAENPDSLLRYRERSLALRDRFLWSGEKRKYVALLHRLAGNGTGTQ
jgi:glycosyltransferase involved in cell wall biosynthesis